MPLDEWVSALSHELGVDVPVDLRLLLDVARDAAHNVDRPAAPLTTFLIGYAAASRGGGSDEVSAAARTAQTLALAWPTSPPSPPETPPETPPSTGTGPTSSPASAAGDGPGG